MDNYKTIATKLENRIPFRGNSLTAIIKDDNYSKGYFVYSYNTLIAVYNYEPIEPNANLLPWESLQRWVNPQKYSQTTSRQQNLIRRAWGI